jgi:hypothetical protein
VAAVSFFDSGGSWWGFLSKIFILSVIKETGETGRPEYTTIQRRREEESNSNGPTSHITNSNKSLRKGRTRIWPCSEICIAEKSTNPYE